jgi:hypothetical protein
MRTKLLATTLLALAVTPACKWTEFDDLEGDTWVTSTEKPNGDSTDYGVAIARGQRGANGGRLVVLGSGQAQYTELVYSPNGDADLAPTALKLNSQFGIGNLDAQPILIPDPVSDDVAVVVNSGGQSIAVLIGTAGLKQNQVFGPSEPDAATYMLPPPNATQPEPPEQVLVANADSVYGLFIMNSPIPQPSCPLVDEAAVPVTVKGLGAVRNGAATSDDVLVWGVPMGGMGKLLMYPGSVFAGCATPQAPIAGWTPGATTFAPARGSQLVMIDSTHVLVVGHKEIGNTESYLGVFAIDPNNKTISMVGTPVTVPDLRTAAIYDDGVSKYVVAGYPTALVDGVKSGQVSVYPLDLTSGISATPAAILHDAQPDEEQQFGRAVAVTPFNGKPVIAVAADNEIFMYFRTTLYDETRMGR